MKCVIIGGVAGGATAAARLRRLDESAEIILLERGSEISFANCGLPYYISGVISDEDELLLQTPESFHARFHVDVRINSEAVSIDPENKTVLVRSAEHEYTETYDKLILSPGAQPIVPPIPGVDGERVFTLRNIPDMKRIHSYIQAHHPKSAVVVGCGFIGIEMAENLMEAGLSVTSVDLARNVIPALDYDMACDVHGYLRGKGLNLLLSSGLTGIEQQADGQLLVTAGEHRIAADMVILSIGVKSESRLAADAGLAVNGRGCIMVNDQMQTSNKDVYAVGDAIEVKNFVTDLPASIPLAGPANRQARVAADVISGIDSHYAGTQGSAIVKIFDMTVAATGINEQTARSLGLDYGKVFTFSPSHAGYYPGAKNMSVKTIYEKKTGRILGAELVGYEGVDKRADVFATAIRAGLTADDLAELELCYAPPFSSAKDPVNVAGYVIQNELRGLVKHFHWHDIASLPRDGSVVLLDVRTTGEYARGHIDGFVNIPLHELRGRIAEIPTDKPVYVHCQSGLRSYVATRLLAGLGFDCYNLSGGYRLYASIAKEQPFCADRDCLNQPYAGSDAALVRDYFHARGLSCSESTMRILQLKHKLDGAPELTKSMTGFGGGMHRGLACGAVTGAVAAIGARLGRSERGGAKEPAGSTVDAFLQEFEARFGSLTCKDLLRNDLPKPQEHAICSGYVQAAVEIASRLIDEQEK